MKEMGSCNQLMVTSIGLSVGYYLGAKHEDHAEFLNIRFGYGRSNKIRLKKT
jgi:hypothetical protein